MEVTNSQRLLHSLVSRFLSSLSAFFFRFFSRFLSSHRRQPRFLPVFYLSASRYHLHEEEHRPQRPPEVVRVEGDGGGIHTTFFFNSLILVLFVGLRGATREDGIQDPLLHLQPSIHLLRFIPERRRDSRSQIDIPSRPLHSSDPKSISPSGAPAHSDSPVAPAHSDAPGLHCLLRDSPVPPAQILLNQILEFTRLGFAESDLFVSNALVEYKFIRFAESDFPLHLRDDVDCVEVAGVGDDDDIFVCNLSLKTGTAVSCLFVSCSCLTRHELKFVSCSCRVRVCPVSCSCLIPQTRIEIRVVFVFAKFVSCKFVSDTDTRHDDTNCQVYFCLRWALNAFASSSSSPSRWLIGLI
ncbi:hypothetical protein LXL04_024952 [Taraxacum kok-saghyz]